MAAWNVAPNKEDRANLEKAKATMIRRGIPSSSITTSSVIRFAVKLAAETK